jgi:membrane complex biogenesis BtpA family protein
MTSRFRAVFGGEKTLIAMAHLAPLPGTPLYDSTRGVDGILGSLRQDLAILLDADFDAVMFCNEGDRPYTLRADLAGVAALTRAVSELAPKTVPFGVDYLWDAEAALSIAAVTGASFVREVVTGVYESDMGLWRPDAARLLRRRRELCADGTLIFMNVTPEFASPLGRRTVAEVARSAVVSSLADAILVSGSMAGSEPDMLAVQAAREGVDGAVPVLVNTGTNVGNIGRFLEVADGAIVGSGLKANGDTWAPVSAERVSAYLRAAGR